MAKNWEHAAGILWDILANAAGRNEKVTYKDVSGPLGTNPLSVRNALEPIQAYCIENRLPPLTAIVVNSGTGLPGPGFIAWDVDDIARANELVFRYSWESVENPYGGYGPDDTTISLATRLLDEPGAQAEVYVKVKARGTAQQVFRHALLIAYEGECAFCGFSFDEALDAAHIVSWPNCTPSERLDVRNGLLLCANHHRLFDCGYVRITSNLRMLHVNSDYSDEEYGESDKAHTVAVSGKPIGLPSNHSHRPGLEYIGRRYVGAS